MRVQRQSVRGMTLVEIMIVIALIGLIATALVLGLGKGWTSGQVKTTQLKAKSIEQQLFMFRLDVGDFPSQSEGLAALTTGERPYLGDVRDSWGRDFGYFNPNRRPKRNGIPEVVSAGGDAQLGTTDDIWSDRSPR